MRVEIRNIAAIKSADIDLTGIVFTTGENEAGKSTLCRTVACLMTGVTLPLDMKKGAAGALVRHGTPEGKAVLIVEGGRIGLTYPKAERISEGVVPRASLVAAGLLSVADLPDKERSNILSDLLGTAPEIEDLKRSLKAAGYGDAAVVKIWENLAKSGWDAIYAKAVKHGHELKGEWRGLTGENYGSDKAPTWFPAGITEAAGTGVTLDMLNAAVNDARQSVENAVGTAAVDAKSIADLRTLSDRHGDLEKALSAAERAEDAAGGALETAREALAKLPAAETDDGMPCPHCGELIKVNQAKPAITKLEKGTKRKITDSELKKRREALVDAQGAINQCERALTTAQEATKTARAQVDASCAAAATLADMATKTGGDAQGDDAVARARSELVTAEARLLKAQADHKHVSITKNQNIIDILAPEGLRKRKTAEALGKFNVTLAELSTAAGWPEVMLTDDLTLAYRGAPAREPYVSESAAMRARIVLQVALAKRDESDIVIIDRGDRLDNKGREGLVTLLKAVGIRALVGMTYSSPSKAPDLAAYGLGTTYWIADGVAKPLGDLAKKAA